MRRILLVLLLLALLAGGYVLLAPSGPHQETFVDITPGTGTMGVGASSNAAG